MVCDDDDDELLHQTRLLESENVDTVQALRQGWKEHSGSLLPVPVPTALHSTWRLACCWAQSLPHLHAAEVERVLNELPRGERQPEQHLDALKTAPAAQPRHRRQRAHQVTIAACQSKGTHRES